MTLYTDAYPDLARELKFFPLGIQNPKCLSNTQIDHYNAKGYVSPIEVFNDNEVGEIRSYFDSLLSKFTAAGWGDGELTNLHKHCPGVYDLVTHRRILDYVQDLLGETLILRLSHFFIKLPGDGKRVSWHQDASYWPLTPSKVVSVWLAIDDVDEANGAMHVIPRSHLDAQIPFEKSDAQEGNVLSQTVKDPEQHGDLPVAIELKAGQMSLHSDWILHGSDVNRSDRRRCGLAMRYLSSDVRAFNDWNLDSVICRGVDSSGHWAHHPRPKHDDIPAKSEDGVSIARALSDAWARKSDS